MSADQEQGYSLGATSTPSFLINGRPIAGAQPLETFTETIEAAAKAAKAKPSKPSEPRKSSPPAGAGEKPGAGQ